VSSSDHIRLGVDSTMGAEVGLLVGGRLVKTYDWRAEWFIPAPLPQVYEAMTSREAVRQWWSSKELVDDGEEDELREGSSAPFRVYQAPMVARIAPPFNIRCIYTNVEPERRLRQVVTGDLNGVLEIPIMNAYSVDPGCARLGKRSSG
jgi:hypothetical protein